MRKNNFLCYSMAWVYSMMCLTMPLTWWILHFINFTLAFRLPAHWKQITPCSIAFLTILISLSDRCRSSSTADPNQKGHNGGQWPRRRRRCQTHRRDNQHRDQSARNGEDDDRRRRAEGEMKSAQCRLMCERTVAVVFVKRKKHLQLYHAVASNVSRKLSIIYSLFFLRL